MRRQLVRSLLFVPGHQPARFDKACHSGADVVVLDLEDAVPVNLKDEARAAVGQWLQTRVGGSTGPLISVRINAADTPFHAQDLALCAHPGLGAVMLPKAEGPATLHALAGAAPHASLWPLVETAQGISKMEAIASTTGVERLVFGSIDLQADLDIEADEATGEPELLAYRSQMVLVSRVAGLPPPIDGVSTVIDEVSRVEADARRARRQGFGGKLCIHPTQVDAVNRSFSPTAAQIDWACRVIDADKVSGGAPVAVDGKMVDRPVVLKAQRVLRAQRNAD